LSTYLALGEHGLDARPGLLLGGVTEQVHDDGTLLDSLVNLEKVDAGLPAILDGLLPAGAVFSDTNDDVEAVVAEVEALAVTLGAVADEGEGIVLEVLLEDGQSRVFSEALMHWYVQGASHGASRRALSSCVSHWVLGMRDWFSMPTVDLLLVAGKVDGLHTALLDKGIGGLGGLSQSRPGGSVDGGDESPLLNGRGLSSLAEGAAESSGCGAGGHCDVIVERRWGGMWEREGVSREVSNGRRGNNPDFSRLEALPVSAARTRLCVISVVVTETGRARRSSPVIAPVIIHLSLTESHLFVVCE
jgi:hypothetical protein